MCGIFETAIYFNAHALKFLFTSWSCEDILDGLWDLFQSIVKTIMTEQLKLRGTLKGHGGWVTQIATTPAVPDMILSSSRGGRLLDNSRSMQMCWKPSDNLRPFSNHLEPNAPRNELRCG